MLRQILDADDGQSPDGLLIDFADLGFSLSLSMRLSRLPTACQSSRHSFRSSANNLSIELVSQPS